MGSSQADKSQSHDRIVRTAAARFRQHGVDGIGVADIMREAGFTHGGFYRHFGSREQLVDEATERALLDGGRAVDAIAGSARASFAALVDAYASTRHRDDLATSCAVTTLASDMARCGPRARAAYTRQVVKYLDLLVRLMRTKASGRSKRARAIAALSMLVGAVSIARAVNDEALSREILRSAAAALKGEVGSLTA